MRNMVCCKMVWLIWIWWVYKRKKFLNHNNYKKIIINKRRSTNQMKPWWRSWNCKNQEDSGKFLKLSKTSWTWTKLKLALHLKFSTKKEEQKMKVWVTILVLIFMHKELSHKKGAWKLILRKAQNFLKKFRIKFDMRIKESFTTFWWWFLADTLIYWDFYKFM